MAHCKLRLLAFGLVSCLFSVSVLAAKLEQDYFVFADVQSHYRYDLESASTLEERDSHSHIVFFHTTSYNERLSSLIEYVVSGEERSLERFQLGFRKWRLFNISIGRGHVPLSKWNTDYHHGSHLETSISRPNATDKMLPRHSSGIEFSGEHLKSQGYFSWELSYGLAPKLMATGLVDYDLLDRQEGHDNQYSIRLTNTLDDTADHLYGFYYGDSTFNSEVVGINTVDQQQIGLFANWSINKLKLIGELTHLKMEFQSAQTLSDDLTSGFIQAELQRNSKFAWFGRLEHTFNDNDSLWLPLVPSAVSNRSLLGIRYDFRGWQALTVETSRSKQGSSQFNGIILRWSGVLE